LSIFGEGRKNKTVNREVALSRVRLLPVQRTNFSETQPNGTCSPQTFWAEKTVNNSHSGNENYVDLTGCFEFLTDCSHTRFGEQAVHIKSL
jgi:hypothetical protein